MLWASSMTNNPASGRSFARSSITALASRGSPELLFQVPGLRGLGNADSDSHGEQRRPREQFGGTAHQFRKESGRHRGVCALGGEVQEGTQQPPDLVVRGRRVVPFTHCGELHPIRGDLAERRDQPRLARPCLAHDLDH